MAACVHRRRIRGLGRHHLPEQHQRHKQSGETAEQQRQDAKDDQAGGAVLVGGQRSRFDGRGGGILFVHRLRDLSLNTPIHETCRDYFMNCSNDNGFHFSPCIGEILSMEQPARLASGWK